jgi:homoserine dehydrogenase
MYNLCFIGFGNVGQALARLLESRTAQLRETYGIEWQLTGVASRRLGWLANPAGLDVAALLAGAPQKVAPLRAGDVATWLAAAEARVLFEMSPLNAATGEPAISYLAAALRQGAHAITANKGPVVHGYHLLRDLAAQARRGFRFESTVMDGAPIFSLFRTTLPLVRVQGFRGILNSTSNVVLDRMEAGASLDEGVAEAQALGLAETDPGNDIDGWDSAVKIAALVTVLMDTPLTPQQIQRTGIRNLTADSVRRARAEGSPYKLVCTAARTARGVRATVAPARIDAADPLAQVNGTSSVVRFETDLLPGLTIVEHDPTPTTTAYGMLADFVDLARTEPGA